MSGNQHLSDSLEAYVLANRTFWKQPLTSINQVTNQLYDTVSDWLNRAINSGNITSYNLREVTPTNDVFFAAEVTVSAKPGDAYVVNDTYEGIIIGVKKSKKHAIATVLKSGATDPRDSRFRIDVAVHVASPLNYVEIKLVV